MCVIMLKLLFGVALLVGLCVQEVQSAAPECMVGAQNVDWWVVYKHHGSNAYHYVSSDDIPAAWSPGVNVWEDGPLYDTFQSRLNDVTIQKFAYNDQGGGGGGAAHEKGIVMFDANTNTGLWISHSQPYYPVAQNGGGGVGGGGGAVGEDVGVNEAENELSKNKNESATKYKINEEKSGQIVEPQGRGTLVGGKRLRDDDDDDEEVDLSLGDVQVSQRGRGKTSQRKRTTVAQEKKQSKKVQIAKKVREKRKFEAQESQSKTKAAKRKKVEDDASAAQHFLCINVNDIQRLLTFLGHLPVYVIPGFGPVPGWAAIQYVANAAIPNAPNYPQTVVPMNLAACSSARHVFPPGSPIISRTAFPKAHTWTSATYLTQYTFDDVLGAGNPVGGHIFFKPVTFFIVRMAAECDVLVDQWDAVAGMYQETMRVQTWTPSTNNQARLANRLYPQLTRNVKSMRLGNYVTQKDHAKWSVNSAGSRICFSGNNRPPNQGQPSSVVICINNQAGLAALFRNSINTEWDAEALPNIPTLNCQQTDSQGRALVAIAAGNGAI